MEEFKISEARHLGMTSKTKHVNKIYVLVGKFVAVNLSTGQCRHIRL